MEKGLTAHSNQKKMTHSLWWPEFSPQMVGTTPAVGVWNGLSHEVDQVQNTRASSELLEGAAAPPHPP